MTAKKSKSKKETLLLTEAQLALIEKLSNACAISGFEGEVRKIILEQVSELADECKIDSLGNVLVIRKSKKSKPDLRVMIAAHMDEIGFMLVENEKEGIFRFEKVGGIDDRQVVGKSVWVGKEHHPGVIGSCPIHLEEDISRKIPVSNLRIDLGPAGDEKAKPGDWATFGTVFWHNAISMFGKALDDRLGVATLIEILQKTPYEVEILAAFTVQEEVGLRGAQVAAYAFDPDIAIVLDSTPAYDLPTFDDEENVFYNTRLGFGPAIYIADSATISDPRLVRFAMQTAEDQDIPIQIRQPGRGGTDAGAIHKQRKGIPSISISVPARNLHTPVSIARKSDWLNQVVLVDAMLRGLKPDVLNR